MINSRDDSAAPGYDDPEGTVRRFLWHTGTGCKFASAFARPVAGPILWVQQGIPRVPGDHLSAAIEQAFRSAAARSHAVGLIFPLAQGEHDLVELISVLAQLPDWSIHELVGNERPAGIQAEVGVFSMLWQTKSGADASVMVLGPLGWLPVTRRAPYLTLMSWTGGRCNALLKSSLANNHQRPVGFIDMNIPVALHARYQQLWDTTRDNAKQMRRHEGVSINAAANPAVAFTVSPEAAKQVREILRINL